MPIDNFLPDKVSSPKITIVIRLLLIGEAQIMRSHPSGIHGPAIADIGCGFGADDKGI